MFVVRISLNRCDTYMSLVSDGNRNEVCSTTTWKRNTSVSMLCTCLRSVAKQLESIKLETERLRTLKC